MLRSQELTIIESCIYQKVFRDTAYLSELELIYLMEGELSVTVGDGPPTTIRAGEALLLRSGTQFSFCKRASGAGGAYRSYLLFFDVAFVRDYLGPENTIKRSEDPGVNYAGYRPSPVLANFAESLSPYFAAKDIPRELLRIKTQELLFHLLKWSLLTLPLLRSSLGKEGHDLKSVMNRYYAEPWTLAEFAARSNRSLSAFRRDFVTQYGLPPGKWLRRKRLETAARLLQLGEVPAREIAAAVGFRGYAHFSRAFKDYHGCSPVVYRDRQKQVN